MHKAMRHFYRGCYRRALSQLSDRELSDIGIRRGDIEIIVRQSMTPGREDANQLN